LARGNIDIWWLYDDGGLPVMLAHILKSRQQFAECTLRQINYLNK
jgi:solute carrier family 12 sodium/potassium/chloride transporter 2